MNNRFVVTTNLEPDILESEVQCPLENISGNKASGDNGIPVSYTHLVCVISFT